MGTQNVFSQCAKWFCAQRTNNYVTQNIVPWKWTTDWFLKKKTSRRLFAFLSETVVFRTCEEADYSNTGFGSPFFGAILDTMYGPSETAPVTNILIDCVNLSNWIHKAFSTPGWSEEEDIQSLQVPNGILSKVHKSTICTLPRIKIANFKVARYQPSNELARTRWEYRIPWRQMS